MTYCITGNYVLDGHPAFNNLSEEVKDLIKGLLCVDPYERYSLEQIKDHPWIKRHKSSTKLSLTSFKEFKLESLTELK